MFFFYLQLRTHSDRKKKKKRKNYLHEENDTDSSTVQQANLIFSTDTLETEKIAKIQLQILTHKAPTHLSMLGFLFT